jgi:hypothetical protein
MAALNSSVFAGSQYGGVVTSSAGGSSLNISELLPPAIQSWRSIPGTQSALLASSNASGGYGNTKLEFVFTYRVSDGAGRYIESGPSNPLDGTVYAKPSKNGSIFTEKVEVEFRDPIYDLPAAFQIV